MTTLTSSVYVSVIEDVINKVREEFINNGPGEDVLKELQGVISIIFPLKKFNFFFICDGSKSERSWNFFPFLFFIFDVMDFEAAGVFLVDWFMGSIRSVFLGFWNSFMIMRV